MNWTYDYTGTCLRDDNYTFSTAIVGTDGKIVAVTQNVVIDTKVPLAVSATAIGTTLTLSYNETLAAATLAKEDFTLTKDNGNGNGNGKTPLSVTAVAFDQANSRVLLTLDTAIQASDVGLQLTYDPAANKIQDIAGNIAAALSAYRVGNANDVTAPALTSPTGASTIVPGANIVLSFSEDVFAGFQGSNTFTISNGSRDQRTIPASETGQVTFTGNTVTINPTEDLLSDTYTVTIGAQAVTDQAGNVPASGATMSAIFTVSAPTMALGGLDGKAGFLLAGAQPGSGAGQSVAGAGDINNDGFDDLLIGALDGASAAGRSFVVFGGATGGANLNLINSNLILNGIAGDDLAGSVVGAAGDVNGDGIGDLLIGANQADPMGMNQAGETYLVFGGGGLTGTVSLPQVGVTVSGMRIEGAAAGDRSGMALAAAGDFNGDGFDDLLIGAPYSAANGADSGAGYLIFGQQKPGASLNLGSLNGSTGFRMVSQAGAQLGFALAAAGDVNGDGLDDVIIGAPLAGSGRGESYVVFGRAGGLAGAPSNLDLATLNGANGFKISGAAAGDQAGISVASAGDVNGDGFNDLIVGAMDADSNGTSSGASYLVFGNVSFAGSAVVDLATLASPAGVRFDGVSLGDWNGRSVSGAGDLNGDGFDDLLIGAAKAEPASIHATTPGDDRGAAYVLFGGAGFGTSLPATLSTLNGSNGFRIDGISAGDNLGGAVSAAGDLNGDGFGDLVIGAPNAGTGTGAAYVIYGANFTGAVLAPGNGASNNITGSASVDRMVGGAGNDGLTGNGGADVLYGGAGDDVMSIADLSFRRIDGGNGSDTLKLAGTGLNLDLSAYQNKIFGIEKIDLLGTEGANTLTLRLIDVLNLSDTSNVLTIDGDATDRVSLVASDGWVSGTSDDKAYANYYAGQAVLRIGIAITDLSFI